MAHLMQEIFGYTDELCRALQKQDEDIVHAIELVGDTKYYLEALRTDAGWDDFLTKVTSFCTKHKIKVVDMEGPYFPVGRPRRGLIHNQFFQATDITSHVTSSIISLPTNHCKG